jgi:glycosyltransferase involved in cell wall biosynthesis
MKISLITVCYNAAETLATAIESVSHQTYQDIEYIVVDGGSTDGTVELLRRYAEEKCSNSGIWECSNKNADACLGPSIRQSGSLKRSGNHSANAESEAIIRQFFWLSESDEGMYDAVNKGIRMATGDVVGILNADDVLADDGVVERIADHFLTTKSTKIDVVYGDVRFVRECANSREGGTPRQGEADPSTNELASLRNAKTLRYYSSKRWKPWMLRWGFMPPHPGVYIRRELFEKLGYYKLGYHIAADYELLIRYLWKAGLKTAYIPQCLVTMRPGGKSTKNWRSNVLLNQEIVRGNRENGYFCCMLMLMPKYFFKIFEFIIPWLK